jgi:hypothetical protein
VNEVAIMLEFCGHGPLGLNRKTKSQTGPHRCCLIVSAIGAGFKS